MKIQDNFHQPDAVRSPHRWWLPIALLIFGSTAWFSEGPFHVDEHFQILEFANFHLGGTPATDLPWEFNARIRPGLQPLLAYGSIRAAQSLGISSPFTQAFLMRLTTGLLCLWMFHQWSVYLSASRSSSLAGMRLEWIFILLWFVPFLSVRFSSENLCALTFWSGAEMLLTGLLSPTDNGAVSPQYHIADPPRSGIHSVQTSRQCFIGAFLLLLSFFFRYQIAFSIIGLSAWLAWQFLSGKSRRPHRRQVLLVAAGALAAIGVGVTADCWLYGEPAFPALNYLQVNILNGRAAEFGTEPWWWYFKKLLVNSGLPVGLLGFILLGIGLWRYRGHVMTWSLLPFLIAHLAIGHKELRFLFPMILPAIVLAVLGFDELVKSNYLAWPGSSPWRAHTRLQTALADKPRFGSGSVRNGTRRILIACLQLLLSVALILNFILLPARSLVATEEPVGCYHFLYDISRFQSLTIVSPFGLYFLAQLPVHFYRDPKIRTIVISDVADGLHIAASTPGGLWVSSESAIVPPPGLSVRRIYSYLPFRPKWPILTRGERRLYVWSVSKTDSRKL